ncbi:MAG: hypothetical protein J6Q68_00630 [Clostridia bacterium]|nr:hypothetical protein [Clostridia bacterium]
MNNKLELGLMESEAVMKKGGLALVNNVGKVIAGITLFVAALVTFTDITFADFRAESFTTSAIMLILASYLMYFSLEDAGEQLCEEGEEYVTARKLYEAERDKICGEDIEALRNFCFEYSKHDLKYRQKNYLISHGLSLSDLEKYRTGEVFTKKQRRALKIADKMRAVSLTPRQVLTKERTATKSELQNPEKRRLFRLIMRLIPTTVGMTVTVSVMLTAKEGLDAGTVIEGILKLSTLPVVGFRGYSNGYSFVKKSCIPWLETKRRILEAFNKENSKAHAS